MFSDFRFLRTKNEKKFLFLFFRQVWMKSYYFSLIKSELLNLIWIGQFSLLETGSMARPFTSKLLHLYHFGLIYLQTRFLSSKSQHQHQQQMRNTLSHLQVASVTFMEVVFLHWHLLVQKTNVIFLKQNKFKKHI